jgi:HJR/Mrr/RecB family endonuclease
MRHRQERYERHDEEWGTLERWIEACEKTEGAPYDPFEQVCSDPPGPGTARQTHLYLLSDFKESTSETQSGGPHRLSSDKLFELPRPPELTHLPNPPLLMLEDSAYPTYFFERPGSDGVHTKAFMAGKALAASIAKLRGEKSNLLSLGGSVRGEAEDKQTIYERKRHYRIELRKRYDKLLNVREARKKAFIDCKNAAIEKYDSLLGSALKDDALEALQIANNKHPLPKFLRKGVRYEIDEEQRVCVVEFEFPDYRNERLVVGWSARRGFIAEDRPKFASEAIKKKLVKECLCSLILRQAYIASLIESTNLFSHVAVNATQTWFDPATGRQQSGTIASLFVSLRQILDINLAQVDPVACVRHLKGLLTPSSGAEGVIRPIFTLDRNDTRLVGNRDVDVALSEQTNLASMDWEDFEHLVAQLLEWEFKNKGIEVGVTQASRDRGVDAILFNPDPMLGGKTVVQAKRYTRTVEVAAVRDLYGTVINEGANRGILITTSSFGPDSYEFAKDKPISLVDGQNLIAMLRKHGRNYRIDLVEARNQPGYG